MLPDKSTKIWLNYLFGAVISAGLLYLLYLQVQQQLEAAGPRAWVFSGAPWYLCFAILLMPLNLALEARKWQVLAGSVEPLSFYGAFRSSLAGLSVSIATPNRIGDYPGRILYLRRKNSARLIAVSLLGIISQLCVFLCFGIAGLVYFNLSFPGSWPQIALVVTVLATAGLLMIYLRFGRWARYLERFRWTRKWGVFSYLLRRLTLRMQLDVLAISAFRFLVFTAQYLLLMKWAGVALDPGEAAGMSFLYFWIISVVPSISLAELGIRGNIALALFGLISGHKTGILTATVLLWCINFALPAALGSLLWIRRKVFRKEKKL